MVFAVVILFWYEISKIAWEYKEVSFEKYCRCINGVNATSERVCSHCVGSCKIPKRCARAVTNQDDSWFWLTHWDLFNFFMNIPKFPLFTYNYFFFKDFYHSIFILCALQPATSSFCCVLIIKLTNSVNSLCSARAQKRLIDLTFFLFFFFFYVFRH